MGRQGSGKIAIIGEERMIKINFLKKNLLLVAGCWLVVTGLTGCGYTSRSMISDKFRTIYITPFVNKIDLTEEASVAYKYRIYRPMLEQDITKAVINKFIFDGNLKPVKKESADLVLKGQLVEFRKDPLRYNEDNDEVAEYRMNIVVNLIMWNNKEDKLVWEENGFTGDFSYFPKSSELQGVTKISDEKAVPDAVADLARRIVERTVEQW